MKQKYKVGTFCDFGQPGRRTCIGRHKTLKTAGNQYPRIWNNYGRLHGWKVWQEEFHKPQKIDPNDAFTEEPQTHSYNKGKYLP